MNDSQCSERTDCHEILLDTTLDQTDTTYFLCNIRQNTEKLHVCTSCIIVCLQASTYIVEIAFTPCDELNVNGVMVAVVPTHPESIYASINHNTNATDCQLHPPHAAKKGYLSIHSLLYRLKYTRFVCVVYQFTY